MPDALMLQRRHYFYNFYINNTLYFFTIYKPFEVTTMTKLNLILKPAFEGQMSWTEQNTGKTQSCFL